MSLRAKFIWFIVLIHLVQVALVVTLYQYDKVFFVVSEVLLVSSFCISLALYRSFLKPHRLLMAGVEALKDQDFSIRVKSVGQKDLDNLIEVFNLMLVQLRSEKLHLTEKNFFLDKLIENSKSGILILDFNHQVSSLNPSAEQMLGVVANKAQGALLEELDSVLAKRLNRIPLNESTVVHLDGVKRYKCTKRSFYEKGAERVFFHMDELTNELIKAEKVSYEKVIRVMAHEVNNTIGAVNSVLNSTLRFEEQIRENISDKLAEAIKSSRDRNDALNTFMRNYADVVKLPMPNLEKSDLRDIAHRLGVLYEHDLKSIDWEESLPDQPMWLDIDASQIELVLSNVVKNAIEAIKEEGYVKVSLDQHSLKIENNGEPISADQQQKIFEAFYTSKANGQGIGLTLTKEILMNHGFDFSLSTNDQGITVFEMKFG
ncbi:sensor histidine kinase [Reichenbachiella versicolor]|uniref:sensor histidine kinase n=1 Tax=Reichenbachiella versicolor TaxID=1821036 RepID=UPI000D6E7111|nr:ATP-binding protein [Reichenbachiella versicolor]